MYLDMVETQVQNKQQDRRYFAVHVGVGTASSNYNTRIPLAPYCYYRLTMIHNEI